MKTAFSEFLSEIISKSGYSKNEIIRLCDIDRSSFYKFLSGSRIPTSEQFEMLCNKLQISNADEKELRVKYALLTKGKRKVDIEDRIGDFLWKLENLNESSVARMVEPRSIIECENSSVISGRGSVLGIMMSIIKDETKQENTTCRIDMFLPPKEEEALLLLYSLIKQTPDNRVEIQQLMELPSSNYESDSLIIDKLCFLVLFTLACPESYTGYYYYTNAAISECVGAFYPYFLITNRCVLLFDAGMNNAIVIKDTNYHKVYEEKFLIALNSAQRYINIAEKKDLKKDHKFSVQYRYGDMGIWNKSLKDNAVAYVSPTAVREYLEKNRNSSRLPAKDSFLRNENPLLNEIRLKLGKQVYLIDERTSPAGRSWTISLLGKEKLVIYRQNSPYYFIISEARTVELFYSFMKELPGSGHLLKEDIAMKYIDKLREEIG